MSAIERDVNLTVQSSLLPACITKCVMLRSITWCMVHVTENARIMRMLADAGARDMPQAWRQQVELLAAGGYFISME